MPATFGATCRAGTASPHSAATASCALRRPSSWKPKPHQAPQKKSDSVPWMPATNVRPTAASESSSGCERFSRQRISVVMGCFALSVINVGVSSPSCGCSTLAQYVTVPPCSAFHAAQAPRSRGIWATSRWTHTSEEVVLKRPSTAVTAGGGEAKDFSTMRFAAAAGHAKTTESKEVALLQAETTVHLPSAARTSLSTALLAWYFSAPTRRTSLST